MLKVGVSHRIELLKVQDVYKRLISDLIHWHVFYRDQMK